jgi:hypothetical protein
MGNIQLLIILDLFSQSKLSKFILLVDLKLQLKLKFKFKIGDHCKFSFTIFEIS